MFLYGCFDAIDIKLEMRQSWYFDYFCVIDCCIEDVHGKGRRAVDDLISWFQDASHEQVDELIGTAANLFVVYDKRNWWCI